MILWSRRGVPVVDCHRWWNMVALLWTCKKASKHGVETDVIAQNQKIQTWAFCRHSDVDAVSGLLRACPQTDLCAMLEEHFKPCIYSKFRGMLTKEVVFHHDDAWLHMVAATVEMIRIRKSSFYVIQHTAQISRHLVPYFWTTHRCVTWMPTWRWWRGQGCNAYVALHNWKHSLQLA